MVKDVSVPAVLRVLNSVSAEVVLFFMPLRRRTTPNAQIETEDVVALKSKFASVKVRANSTSRRS